MTGVELKTYDAVFGATPAERVTGTDDPLESRRLLRHRRRAPSATLSSSSSFVRWRSDVDNLRGDRDAGDARHDRKIPHPRNTFVEVLAAQLNIASNQIDKLNDPTGEVSSFVPVHNQRDGHHHGDHVEDQLRSLV